MLLTVARAAARAAPAAAMSVAAVLAACAGGGAEPRTPYETELRRMSAAGAALLVEGCVLRDPGVGPAYILRQASVQAARIAAAAAAHHLRARGQLLTAVDAALVCAAGPGGDAVPGLAADPDTAVPEAASAPLPVGEQPGEVGAVLAALFQQVAQSPALRRGPGAARTVPLRLDDSARRLLRNALSVNDVWLVYAGGVESGNPAPAGPAGSASALSGRLHEHAYQAALVDLVDGELLWKTARGGLRGHPVGGSPFNAAWASAAFDSILPAAARPPWAQADARAALNPAVARDPARARPARPPMSALEAPSVTISETPPPAPADGEADDSGDPPIATSALGAATGTPVPLGGLNPPALSLPTDASPERLTLPAAAPLRARPTPDSEVLVELGAGEPVDVLNRLRNGTGRWWYVRVGEREGWLAPF